MQAGLAEHMGQAVGRAEQATPKLTRLATDLVETLKTHDKTTK